MAADERPADKFLAQEPPSPAANPLRQAYLNWLIEQVRDIPLTVAFHSGNFTDDVRWTC